MSTPNTTSHPGVDKVWRDAQSDIVAIDPVRTNWKNQALPLARIKKIMKSEEGVQPDIGGQRFMIASEAPLLLGKACQLFVRELSVRAWRHTEHNKRRTLQRLDVNSAVSESDEYDFLIDIIPRTDGGSHPPPATGSVPEATFSQPAIPPLAGLAGGKGHAAGAEAAQQTVPQQAQQQAQQQVQQQALVQQQAMQQAQQQAMQQQQAQLQAQQQAQQQTQQTQPTPPHKQQQPQQPVTQQQQQQILQQQQLQQQQALQQQHQQQSHLIHQQYLMMQQRLLNMAGAPVSAVGAPDAAAPAVPGAAPNDLLKQQQLQFSMMHQMMPNMMVPGAAPAGAFPGMAMASPAFAPMGMNMFQHVPQQQQVAGALGATVLQQGQMQVPQQAVGVPMQQQQHTVVGGNAGAASQKDAAGSNTAII